MHRLLLLIIFFVVTACAPRPKVVVPEIEPSRELAQGLLERLSENAALAQSLEGFARVRIVHPERRIGTNQVLFVAKPDRMRSETLSPFGQPVLLAATDGDLFSVYIPSERAFYRGAATPDNIQRFVPIPLQIADLVHIVLYDPPLIPYTRTQLHIEAERGYVLVLAAGEAIRQELVFDGRLRLREVTWYHDETTHMRVRYEQFSDLGGGAFPLTIEMSMPVLETQATVELRDIELNRPIPLERFSLAPPEGVPVLPIP